MNKKRKWFRSLRAKYARKLMKTQNMNRRLILYGLILLVNDQLTGRVRMDNTLENEKKERLAKDQEINAVKKSLPSLKQVEQTSLF